MNMTTLALLLAAGCGFPQRDLGSDGEQQHGGAMTLTPGDRFGALVALDSLPDLPEQGHGDDTAPADTGGPGDTGDGGGVDSGDGGAVTDSGSIDTGPDLTACDGAGYVTASTTATYAGGSGVMANLGTLSGVGYLCDWSCSGDPWWVVLSVTTDGACADSAGAMPVDVTAVGSVELCARVYSTGVPAGRYTDCTATYTGGSVVVEVSG